MAKEKPIAALSFSIEVVNQTSQRLVKKDIRVFAEAALTLLAKSHQFRDFQMDLTVAFVSAAEIRKINKKYRRKNKPTDVLSFFSDFALGDLILSPEVIRQNAKTHGVRFKDELTYVLLHGILHLLGYDHESSAQDAQEMFQLQDRLYNQLATSFALKPVR